MTDVDAILDAGSPSPRWISVAFLILAGGWALAYFGIWRTIKPTDFVPSSNYAVYAGLFIMALAIERVLEPFSGLFVPAADKKKVASSVTTTKAKRLQVDGSSASEDDVKQAQTDAAKAKKAAHWSQAARAVVMWATASALAMLACAALGIFLLRSVQTPADTGSTKATAAVATAKNGSAPASPSKYPNRWLDLLVTGLVVGAGTKPLHDLVTQIQTSSGNSKSTSASTSA